MPLERWSAYFKKNLFSNHDGFFELPYLSNSASLMVESVIKLPVSRHEATEQTIYTDTPFTSGAMRYRKIEEGLWLLGSSLDVKRNIISKALYDEQTESEYYFLSIAVFEYKFPVDDHDKALATLISTTCTFYKPLTAVNTFFYEGTRGRFFNIVFNKAWTEKNLSFDSAPEKKEIEEYLNNEPGFINWIDIVPDAPTLSDDLWNKMDASRQHASHTQALRAQLQQIIAGFFKHAYQDKRIKNHVALYNPDYGNVAAAEKMILTNLHAPFIGVEQIARAVNLSATKLKMIFKSVFGFSMLQYHKEKNMLLAMQLLKCSSMQVKNIASLTGYTSSSKFTAAFKKRFNLLPTDLRS